MKRESSYNFANSGKQQAALLRSAVLVLSFITVAQSLCWDNSQCPGDQVCIVDKTRKKSSSLEVEPSENSSDFKAKTSGNCGCPENFVLWKWRCFKFAANLGDSCVVSLQCREGQYCNPLSKRCSCPIGIEDCTMAMTTKVVTVQESPEDHHQRLFKSMIADMNKTLHETLINQTKGHTTTPSTIENGWTNEQIQTIVYIALAFFVVISFIAISALYMRSQSEKKRSAAAIKSLLDLMAENRSLQSVYTMDGLCATSNHHEDNIPSVLKDTEKRPPAAFEGRIKLDPLADDMPRFPAPHMSAPVLPPIAKRPRPVGQKAFEDHPSPSGLAAISDNLTTLQAQQAAIKLSSAASFPDDYEDLSPIKIDLPKEG